MVGDRTTDMTTAEEPASEHVFRAIEPVEYVELSTYAPVSIPPDEAGALRGLEPETVRVLGVEEVGDGLLRYDLEGIVA